MLDFLNPYMLWVKLGAIAVLIAALLGVCLYIRSVFNERTELLFAKGQLTADLQTEKSKVEVAMEQLKHWQDTVGKMNVALRNIKVESNTYIQGVEDANPNNIGIGVTVPIVLSGMSAKNTLPRFTSPSSGRIRSATP